MQRQFKAPVLQNNETRGNPIDTFNRQVTPIGRAIQLRLSFGSIIWHRPVAVEVRQGNTKYRLPIYNATRRVLGAVYLTALSTILVPLVIQKISRRRRKPS